MKLKKKIGQTCWKSQIRYIISYLQFKTKICWENKRVHSFWASFDPLPLCMYYLHSPFDGMKAYNCLPALTILLETPWICNKREIFRSSLHNQDHKLLASYLILASITCISQILASRLPQQHYSKCLRMISLGNYLDIRELTRLIWKRWEKIRMCYL